MMSTLAILSLESEELMLPAAACMVPKHKLGFYNPNLEKDQKTVEYEEMTIDVKHIRLVIIRLSKHKYIIENICK